MSPETIQGHGTHLTLSFDRMNPGVTGAGLRGPRSPHPFLSPSRSSGQVGGGASCPPVSPLSAELKGPLPSSPASFLLLGQGGEQCVGELVVLAPSQFTDVGGGREGSGWGCLRSSGTSWSCGPCMCVRVSVVCVYVFLWCVCWDGTGVTGGGEAERSGPDRCWPGASRWTRSIGSPRRRAHP